MRGLPVRVATRVRSGSSLPLLLSPRVRADLIALYLVWVALAVVAMLPVVIAVVFN